MRTVIWLLLLFAVAVIAATTLGTNDGVEGDHMLFTPPLIINRAQVDEIIAIFDESLTTIEAELRDSSPTADATRAAPW